MSDIHLYHSFIDHHDSYYNSISNVYGLPAACRYLIKVPLWVPGYHHHTILKNQIKNIASPTPRESPKKQSELIYYLIRHDLIFSSRIFYTWSSPSSEFDFYDVWKTPINGHAFARVPIYSDDRSHIEREESKTLRTKLR